MKPGWLTVATIASVAIAGAAYAFASSGEGTDSSLASACGKAKDDALTRARIEAGKDQANVSHISQCECSKNSVGLYTCTVNVIWSK